MQSLGDRGNMSEAAAEVVRAMIVDGRLAGGERINEVRLAGELGLSRTPLREALSGLVAEGALIARPRLGFFVAPLSLNEFEQLYDIRPLLDPEALRLAGVPDAKSLARLERLDHQIATAHLGEHAITLDDEWHFALIEACPNKVLLELIASIMRRTRRYELALMRETEHVHRANAEHARIMAALRARDLDGACAALKRNMQSGKAPIVAWLKARDVARKVGKWG
jgi:DNA-binding GntR family transcriptional regulator